MIPALQKCDSDDSPTIHPHANSNSSNDSPHRHGPIKYIVPLKKKRKPNLHRIHTEGFAEIDFNKCFRFEATCPFKECEDYKNNTIFTSQQEYQHHHGLKHERRDRYRNNLVWTCPQCKKQCSSFYNFSAHVSMHRELCQPPWICTLSPMKHSKNYLDSNQEICGKRSSTKNNLISHIRSVHKLNVIGYKKLIQINHKKDRNLRSSSRKTPQCVIASKSYGRKRKCKTSNQFSSDQCNSQPSPPKRKRIRVDNINTGMDLNMFGDYSNFNVFPLDNANVTNDDMTVGTANSSQSAHTPNNFGQNQMNSNNQMNVVQHSPHCCRRRSNNNCNQQMRGDKEGSPAPCCWPTLNQILTLCQALTCGARDAVVDRNILMKCIKLVKKIERKKQREFEQNQRKMMNTMQQLLSQSNINSNNNGNNVCSQHLSNSNNSNYVNGQQNGQNNTYINGSNGQKNEPNFKFNNGTNGLNGDMLNEFLKNNGGNDLMSIHNMVKAINNGNNKKQCGNIAPDLKKALLDIQKDQIKCNTNINVQNSNSFHANLPSL